MKNSILLTGFLAVASIVFCQESDLLLPSAMKREQIIHNKGFSLSYSSAYVVSSWLTYKLNNAEVDKTVKVKPKFIPDPSVTTRSASKKDFKEGGYVMAQLCNYLDVMHIDGAVEESFYMTNIVPMKLAFHKNMWLKTEDLIRLWLKDKSALYIITGPITSEAPFPTLGTNKVSVPKHFYKVVYDKENHEAIAFKFKNGMSSGTLKSYTLSVEKLEEITEIDYFPEMDEEKKKQLKSNVNYDFWNFELEEEL